MNRTRLLSGVVLAAAATIALFPMWSPDASSVLAEDNLPGGKLNLDSPAPPNTDLVAQPDFDFFAWNSFVAMFWPALDPDENNNQRGYPDLSTSFVAAASDTPAVWETFKEKREVFNFPAPASEFPKNTQALPPWNHELAYGPLREATDETAHEHADGRILSTTAKQHHYDSFDETIEVVSEALEATLPGGAPNPLGPVPGERSGRPVGPRVWRGQPAPETAVFYEVKVNYDYYRYVEEHDYNVAVPKFSGSKDLVNQNSATDALTGSIAFPYRTSAASGPKAQKALDDHRIVVGYSPAATTAAYKKVTSTSNFTPPAIGSVQIKAAWIILQDSDDPKRYHTTEATYYVSDSKGKPVPRQAQFGLVGIHIIQRVHLGSGKDPGDAKGGTFVFATWEHVDNDKAGYTYSNYYDPLNDPAPPIDPKTGEPYQAGFYPPLTSVYPVKRRFQPISQKAPRPLGTQEVNETVWAAIRKRNPESVWLNYRLIGTQFQAVDINSAAAQVRPAGSAPDYPETRYPVTQYDPTGIGQPVYLANLVIETNADLQFFQGIPPGAPTIDKYHGVGVLPNNPQPGLDPQNNNYLRDGKNLSFARNAYNMGGCMGCHGVAQSLGYSFSFVLKGGYAGATTDTQDHFDIAGATHQDSSDSEEK